jgi:hypothetical protein
MPDADPAKPFTDSRTNLRETAKWIVTILGATVVLVIGGGLIAKISDLDWEPRLAAAISLVALAGLCLIPLSAAVEVIASKPVPLRDMATSADFAATRTVLDDWLNGPYPAQIDTVAKLYARYTNDTAALNNAASDAERKAAQQALGELQPYIKEVVELCSTENMRLKFERMVARSKVVLPGIAIALFVFLVSSHKDTDTEKLLAKPNWLEIPWSADSEDVLKKAGLDVSCFAKTRPRLVQISEKAGLRAGVIVVPQERGCRPIRAIVTKDNELYAAD